MDRKKATILATVAITLLGSVQSLSNGMLSHIQIPFLNQGSMNFMDWMVLLSDHMLPVGGLFISLFVGWKMAKEMSWTKLQMEACWKKNLDNIYLVLTKYVAPVGIIAVIANMLGFFG